MDAYVTKSYLVALPVNDANLIGYSCAQEYNNSDKEDFWGMVSRTKKKVKNPKNKTTKKQKKK